MLWAHVPARPGATAGCPPGGRWTAPAGVAIGNTPRTAAECRKLELLPILPSVLTAFRWRGVLWSCPPLHSGPARPHRATAPHRHRTAAVGGRGYGASPGAAAPPPPPPLWKAVARGCCRWTPRRGYVVSGNMAARPATAGAADGACGPSPGCGSRTSHSGQGLHGRTCQGTIGNG